MSLTCYEGSDVLSSRRSGSSLPGGCGLAFVFVILVTRWFIRVTFQWRSVGLYLRSARRRRQRSM
jgi:hypothetical protein